MRKQRLVGAFCAGILLLGLASTTEAAIITLDFTSGTFSNDQGTINSSTGDPTPTVPDTYTQDGFTLTVQSSGNHVDAGGGPVGNFSFHNGPFNPVTDNNLILTFSGGAFDLTSIDFSNTGPLELIGSNGSTEVVNTIGVNSLSFFGVSSVIFSATNGQPGWNSLTVDTTPSSVPVPAAIWLLGSGLLCMFGVVKRNKA